MIVKKLWSTLRFKNWINKFGYEIHTRYYIGYFLFGFIPLYIKLLDHEIDFYGCGDRFIKVYRKYKDII